MMSEIRSKRGYTGFMATVPSNAVSPVIMRSISEATVGNLGEKHDRIAEALTLFL